jgi:hypothetical protein
VTITTPGASSGNVVINYQLVDAESDTGTIVVEVSLNGGAFTPATAGAGGDGTTALTSSSGLGTAHTYQWNSIADVGIVACPAVRIRITPSDAQGGSPVTTANFSVDNSTHTPPSATITTPGGTQTGQVTISYKLIDAESDACSVAVAFSTNGGTTFAMATPGVGGEATSQLASSPPTGTSHTFVWDSFSDGVALASANATVQFKVTPNDGQAGTAATTANFTVDNSTISSGSSAGGGFPIVQPSETAVFEVASDGTNLYTIAYTQVSAADTAWHVEKRLCSTGALVAGFGAAGVVTSNPGPGDDSGNLHIRIDGTYMYLMSGRETSAGSDVYEFYMEKRLLSTGALVTAFNSTGTLTGVSMGQGGAGSLIVDDTSIYVVMSQQITFADRSMRLEKRDKTTGALIAGFGSGGIVTENPTAAYDVLIQLVADGTNLYLVGGRNLAFDAGGNLLSASVWIEKRLMSTGDLVSGFGTGGSVTETQATSVIGIDIAQDGTSMYLFVTNDTAVWHLEKRSLADGSLTTSLDSPASDPGANQGAAGAPTQLCLSGSSLYVFGINTGPAPGNDQWRIEKRKTSDLSLDTSFNTTGVVLSNPTSGSDGALGATVSGGLLYVVGFQDNGAGGWSGRIEKRWK